MANMNWAVRDAIQDDVIPVWNLVLIVHLLGVELSFLDPSVWALGLQERGYLDDTLTTVIPLRVSG
ncbi:MAG: hypothetical protein LBE46_02125 [Wolbachia pipientis]|jgi:hypothetical protein|nr:hypothetical protein [Wolbachia pipientis]